MLLTAAAFILVLGVLIFVHELGHFLAAKAAGIAVPRFSIGFGPPTPLKFRRGETEYLVSWFPLGGYVKMASREEQEAMASLEGGGVGQEFPPERLFESKPLAARILVISAGVIMNVLFAWAAYSAMLAIYGRPEDPTVAVARVDAAALPEAAAALSRVGAGDRVLRVGGDGVDSWGAILEGVLDPASPRLELEFAEAGAIVLEVPGSDAEARLGIARALVPQWPPRVASVADGQPADAAGIEEDDLFTAVDGVEIRSWDELVRALEPSAGQALRLTLRRGDEVIEKTVVPAEVEVEDPRTGETEKVGRIGIGGPKLEARWIPVSAAAAIVEGARRVWSDGAQLLGVLEGMVLGRISLRQLGGPIFIGQVSGQVARAGGAATLAFMALLSVNLAILNLLPIPVLDGGHLIFLLLEGVRGKPLSQALRVRLTQAGVFVLLGIMAFVLVNDFLRILSGS